MAIRPLSELRPKEKGTIVKVEGRGAIHRRILDMGMVVGSEVEVERVAPLGDPIAIKVKGYQLALRRQEAANVQVDVSDEGRTAVPLSFATPGRPLRVFNVNAGWGLRRRLARMGLTPGAEIRLVSPHSPGPLVVEVGGLSITLGHGVAQKVMVREE